MIEVKRKVKKEVEEIVTMDLIPYWVIRVVRIGGIRGEDVERATELAVSMFENKEETVMSPDYSDTNVSVKVVKLIQSYTDIVNRTVWLKR